MDIDGNYISGKWKEIGAYGKISSPSAGPGNTMKKYYVFDKVINFSDWELEKYAAVTFLFDNGDTYKGEYKNFKRHGIGIYTYADGTRIRGMWSNGVLIGGHHTKYDEVILLIK